MARRLLTVCAVVACACGPHPSTTGTGPGTGVVQAPEELRPFVVADGDIIHALARDADYLYWADTTGIKRRKLGGPETAEIQIVSRATDGYEVTALAVHGGRVYAANGASVLDLPADPKVKPPDEPDLVAADIGWVFALAADDSGVYASIGTSIVKLVKGAEPVTIADGQSDVLSIVLDATHVYWAEHDVDPDGGSPYVALGPEVVGAGAVRKAPKAGGAVVDLAVGQASPYGVALQGDRVWWSSERGVALRSLAKDKERRARLELPGRATAIAADERGVVVVTGSVGGSTLLVEKSGAAPAHVLAGSDHELGLLPRPPVLAGDWAYVVTMRQDSGTAAILAVPRRDRGVSVALGVDQQLLAMRAHDGAVYWAETPRSGMGGVSFWRADPDDGTRRSLGRGGGWITGFAIGGAHLYYAEDTVIYRMSLKGGSATAVRYTDNAVYALTVHRHHAFWLTGTALMAMKKSGGTPFELARNDYGYYGGDAGTDLVFDDDYVYTTALSGVSAGVMRISERGEVTMLWGADESGAAYPGPPLVKLGDQLFFVTGGTGIMAIGVDGRDAKQIKGYGSATIHDIAGGNGLLYALVQRHDEGDQFEVVRITPGEAETVTVLRWMSTYGGEPPRLDVDDAGAYVYSDVIGGFVRISHGAQAIPQRGG